MIFFIVTLLPVLCVLILTLKTIWMILRNVLLGLVGARNWFFDLGFCFSYHARVDFATQNEEKCENLINSIIGTVGRVITEQSKILSINCCHDLLLKSFFNIYHLSKHPDLFLMTILVVLGRWMVYHKVRHIVPRWYH